MKTNKKTTFGLITSIVLIAAGVILIYRARTVSVETVKIIDPTLYSAGPEEQMIASRHSSRTEIREKVETNYFILIAGVVLIALPGGFWIYRFAAGDEKRSGKRDKNR